MGLFSSFIDLIDCFLYFGETHIIFILFAILTLLFCFISEVVLSCSWSHVGLEVFFHHTNLVLIVDQCMVNAPSFGTLS